MIAAEDLDDDPEQLIIGTSWFRQAAVHTNRAAMVDRWVTTRLAAHRVRGHL
jgi:hypothetical protein